MENDAAFDKRYEDGLKEGYHRGSPKLLHMYMNLGEIKEKLQAMELERLALLEEKSELEDKIMYENSFLDRVDYGL